MTRLRQGHRVSLDGEPGTVLIVSGHLVLVDLDERLPRYDPQPGDVLDGRTVERVTGTAEDPVIVYQDEPGTAEGWAGPAPYDPAGPDGDP